MDVEAQDDGVLAKIIVRCRWGIISLTGQIGDGTGDVPVGKLIAVLAEEGDDLATLEMPSDDEAPKASTSQPAPSPASKSNGAKAAEETLVKGGSYEARSDTKPPPEHSPAKAHDVHISHAQPLFPSVQFLLAEAGISDANAIKATGKHGRLTKADVLLHLGKLPSNDVRGTAKDAPDTSVLPEHSRRGGSKSTAAMGSPAGAAADVAKPPDARSFRRMIVDGLASAPQRLAAAKAASSPIPLQAPRVISFEDVVGGYVPAPSPVARLDLPLSKAPRLCVGLPKGDPLRMVLET